MVCPLGRPFFFMGAMRRFIKDSSGATVIEYAFIAALVAMVVLGGIMLVGDGTTGKYNEVRDRVDESM
jgi:Flp pilus assembly pilin Flp